MSITVKCPGCDSRLSMPDALGGKRIKCPKCQSAVVVPVSTANEEDGFEGESDETPARRKPSTSKKSSANPDRIADSGSRKRRVVEEDDDESVERPKSRKTKKKVKAGATPKVLIGAVACLLLGGAAFAVYWFAIRDSNKPAAASARNDTEEPKPAPSQPNPPSSGSGKDKTPTTGQPKKDKVPEQKRLVSPTPATDLPPLKMQHAISMPTAESIGATPNGDVVTVGTFPLVVFVDLAAPNSMKNRILEGHKNRINMVAVSRNGKFLASAGMDHLVQVWDLEANEVLHKFELTSDRPTVAFTPDNKTLILAGADEKDIKLWDIASREVKTTLPHPRVVSLMVTADGKLLAAGGVNARVWNLEKGGEPLVTTPDQGGWVQGVAVTPDGKTLITGSADGYIKIWEVAMGAIRTTIDGHDGRAVNSLAMSQNGKVVVSGGGNSIGVWDVATGKGLAGASVPDTVVSSVVITDTGKKVLTASFITVRKPKGDWKGGVHVWDLSAYSVGDTPTP